MHIAFVGNYTARHTTENHLALTFEDLGHEVTRIQEGSVGALDIKQVEGHDLFFWVRTWEGYVTLEHLKQIKALGIPTVNYHLDLFIGLDRGREELLETDPRWRCDYTFTPDGDPASQAVFEAKGINHYYMKPGVFKPECYIAENDGANLLDVLFVGGGEATGIEPQYGHKEWPYRGELIKFLRDTYGDRFIKKGHPQETVRNEQLNHLYRMAKVTVGDSLCLNFNHPYYWSDRVYETLGRGGFMIHPYIKGMEEEFTDGETIVFYEYGNWDQLKDKINFYLEHDTEREAIRRAGHEFVKNHATYHNRLEQMLDVISAAGTVPTPMPAAPIKINLGAGSEPERGVEWVNVDWLPLDGIQVVQNLLETPWTDFADGCAEYIKAIDVLEHMPNYTPDNKATAIAFVEECHRILQTGGELFITVPHWESKNLWIDPTHVRGYDEKSMEYFDPSTDFGKWYGYYSDKKFKVNAVRTENDNVEFTMVKI